MPSLSGIQLRQLIPTTWNASSRDLRPYGLTIPLFKSITDIIIALEELKLNTSRMRRHRLDTQIYVGSKLCPFVLEIVGLRVPAPYTRVFTSFNICSSRKNCSSARFVSAIKFICRDVDVIGAKNVLLNHIM
jgi:hypothetical protein